MKILHVLRITSSIVALAAVLSACAQTHPVAPSYSSNPGATYTLYLDFSGFSYPGTWGGGTPGVVPAFSTDGDYSTFSAADNAAIANTWAAVAQKYVGFNVNVTTVDPYVASPTAGTTDATRKAYYDSQAHMMHTIIGGSNAWYSSGAGGVSYVGTTQYAYPNSEYHTNWVFPQNEGPNNPKDIGEAASHENGHGLGLEHQTDPGDPNGYSTNHNASGNGSYAPIMGVGYYSQRSTWREGTSANNSLVQNDVQTILQQSGMGALQNDGIGHSLVTATSLAINGNGTVNENLSGSKGFIVPADSTNPNPLGVDSYTKDYFRFYSNGGLISLVEHDGTSLLQAGVADPGATFEGTLKIYNSTGVLVGSGVEDASTLFTTYTGLLTAGNYYAEIASIGGVTSTYDTQSSYYTMGGYFLTGSGFSTAPTPEPTTLVALSVGAFAFVRRRRQA